MAGRFPLYTDADVAGPLVSALRRAGWDVVRAVDLYPERTKDRVHHERARSDGRVLIANDKHMLTHAGDAAAEGRPFSLIWFPRALYAKLTIAEIVARIEAIAAREQPFDDAYPVIVITA